MPKQPEGRAGHLSTPNESGDPRRSNTAVLSSVSRRYNLYSRSWEEHIRDLRVVFERLQLHGLRVSVSKCQIGRANVEYLGYQVTAGDNIPQPVHLRGVEKTAVPKTRRELREFLGLCNWLREYVPSFAAYDQSVENQYQIQMDGSSKRSYAGGKSSHAQTSTTCQTRLLPTLQTDASGHGVAAVLFHAREDGGRDVVSYASARLSEAERRYHSNEQEALAAVWASRNTGRT